MAVNLRPFPGLSAAKSFVPSLQSLFLKKPHLCYWEINCGTTALRSPYGPGLVEVVTGQGLFCLMLSRYVPTVTWRHLE